MTWHLAGEIGNDVLLLAWIIVFIKWVAPWLERHPVAGLWWWGGWTVFATGYCAWYLVHGDLPNAGIQAFFAALFAWIWWDMWNRRKRKPSLGWLGAKSKALLDTLVYRQREATVPTR